MGGRSDGTACVEWTGLGCLWDYAVGRAGVPGGNQRLICARLAVARPQATLSVLPRPHEPREDGCNAAASVGQQRIVIAVPASNTTSCQW